MFGYSITIIISAKDFSILELWKGKLFSKAVANVRTAINLRLAIEAPGIIDPFRNEIRQLMKMRLDIENENTDVLTLWWPDQFKSILN